MFLDDGFSFKHRPCVSLGDPAQRVCPAPCLTHCEDMKRRATTGASGAESSRCTCGATPTGQHAAPTPAQSNSQYTSPTLTDVPAECLQLISSFFKNAATKNAALRTCVALRSATLETCVVWLKVKFPQRYPDEARSGAGSGIGGEGSGGEGSESSSEEDSEGCSEGFSTGELRRQQAAWQQHVRILQQAKHVSLELHCESQEECGDNECLKEQAVPDMLAWLAEMYQQCNGPLLSVCKLAVTGEPIPEATLPSWFSIYCPKATHLAAAHVSKMLLGRYGLQQVATRVYQQLKSIELVDVDQEHMQALIDAPHLTEVTLSEQFRCKQGFVYKRCIWRALRVAVVCLETISCLPWDGVEHLVLGYRKAPSWVTLSLPAQAMQSAIAHLSKYSKVTLSTDRGLSLNCYGLSTADVALALPLLQYAQPYQKSAGKASGMLMLSRVKIVTVAFLESLCNALPHTITKIGFLSSGSFEQGALERLLPLMPPHVKYFTLLDDQEVVRWIDVKAASVHATRPLAVLVPTHHVFTMPWPFNINFHRRQPGVHEIANVAAGLANHWPAIEESMCAHGHQHVRVKVVNYKHG